MAGRVTAGATPSRRATCQGWRHISEQVEEDDPSKKLRRIRDIHLAGFGVQHVIHRYGVEERTTFRSGGGPHGRLSRPHEHGERPRQR